MSCCTYCGQECECYTSGLGDAVFQRGNPVHGVIQAALRYDREVIEEGWRLPQYFLDAIRAATLGETGSLRRIDHG